MNKSLFFLLFLLIFTLTVSASRNVIVSDQGTDVVDKNTDLLVEEGNLTVFLYTVPISGTPFYNETFVRGIRNGSWNVMLGETSVLSLDYGHRYYKDYAINGVDLDFKNNSGGTVERLAWDSPLGEINSSFIANLTDTKWNITGSKYLFNDSGILDVNESRMNATNDLRYVNVDGDNMTGNLFVDANVSAVYFIGDGSKLTGIEQGELILYFLNKTSADISGNKTLSSIPNSTEVSLVGSSLGDGITNLGEWITDKGVPNIDLIEGNLRVHVAGMKSSSNKIVQFFYEVYVTDENGNNEVLLGTSDYSTPLTTTRSDYTMWVLIPETMLNLTDRIRVKGYVYVSGSGVAPTVTAYIQGQSKTRLVLPVGAVSVEKFVPYDGAIKDVDLGMNNLSAKWFNGFFNWFVASVSQRYLSFNGSVLSFNESMLNYTIDLRNNDNFWNITGSKYLYNDSGILDVNETRLNETIISLSSNASESPWTNDSSQIRIRSGFPNFVNISDVLFVNGTSNRTGIGTSSPLAKLHVEGGEYWLFDDGNDVRFVIGDTPSTGDYGWLQWDSVNNYFRIDTSDAASLGLKIRQNFVAIGNVFPDEPLIVSNNSDQLFKVQSDKRVIVGNSSASDSHFEVYGGNITLQNSTGTEYNYFKFGRGGYIYDNGTAVIIGHD